MGFIISGEEINQSHIEASEKKEQKLATLIKPKLYEYMLLFVFITSNQSSSTISISHMRKSNKVFTLAGLR